MSSRVNCSKKCLHLNKKYANICFVERFVQQSISRRVGMADDADSKSVGCTPVRVQVPPPAVMKRQDVCPVFLHVKRADIMSALLVNYVFSDYSVTSTTVTGISMPMTFFVADNLEKSSDSTVKVSVTVEPSAPFTVIVTVFPARVAV